MKKLIVLIVILGSSSVSATESFRCFFVLNGPKTYPDKILEEKIKTLNECKVEVKRLLKINPHYDKGVIMSGEKSIEVTLK